MGRKIIVDGSNVAFEERSAGGDPKVSNLVALRRELKQRGFDPVIIVDASLYHRVDDADQLNGLINKEQVHQVPAGTQADFWVLEIAEKEEALVLSNDRFQPYLDRFPWVTERRVPFMIIDGSVYLYAPVIEATIHVETSEALQVLPGKAAG